MSKGFTLIEVLFSMMIVAIIMVVVNSVYITGLKELPRNLEKSKIQTNLDYTIDSIFLKIKESNIAPDTYTNGPNSFNHASSGPQTYKNALILQVPAQDTAGNFLYNGSAFQLDTYIYYLSGGNLVKRVYGYSGGKNAAQEGSPTRVLANVSSFNCVYTPVTDPASITCNIALSKNSFGKTLNLATTKTATLRNK
jgi:prepilin-type N-terminal cleavage/methylation domain-containing protein